MYCDPLQTLKPGYGPGIFPVFCQPVCEYPCSRLALTTWYMTEISDREICLQPRAAVLENRKAARWGIHCNARRRGQKLLTTFSYSVTETSS